MLHIYCSNTLGDLTPGSSGRPVPGYKLRLVDESGRDLGPGESGFLLVSGDSCATLYWQRFKLREAEEARSRGPLVGVGDGGPRA